MSDGGYNAELWPKAEVVLGEQPLGHQAITIYWKWHPGAEALCLRRLVSEPEWRLRRAGFWTWITEMMYQ